MMLPQTLQLGARNLAHAVRRPRRIRNNEVEPISGARPGVVARDLLVNTAVAAQEGQYVTVQTLKRALEGRNEGMGH
jgi:hypothetical protein